MINEDSSGLLTLRKWVTVAHHIPGRIRLSFTNNLIALLAQSKISMLDKFCDEKSPLKNYSFNANTASLVLEYDTSLLAPSLITQLFSDNEQKAVEALVEIVPKLSLNRSE